MSCDAFFDVVPELARGTLPAAEQADALAHVSRCEACAARLHAEGGLTRDLRSWAAADAQFEAPLFLEARLRRALRARRRQTSGRRRGVPAWVWPVAAAVAGLALWGARPRETTPVRSAAAEEVVFKALPGADLDDVDGYQVVRVKLSRPALARLGFPVGDLEARAVAADVVVGQDGVARGIRLVR